MAQSVALVRGAITTTGTSTDLTSSGFGTPDAAIVFYGKASSGVNPSTGYGATGVLLTDGTTTRSFQIAGDDGVGTSNTERYTHSSRLVISDSALGVLNTWDVALITDGIRFTLVTDNTNEDPFCIVVLLKGVDAQVSVPDVSDEIETSSFDPTLAIAAGHGNPGAIGSGNHAILHFGAAEDGGLQRCLGFGDQDNVGTTSVTQRLYSDKMAAQLLNGSEAWSSAAGTFGTGSFSWTNTGSPSTDVKGLMLLGGDVSAKIAGFTSPTSTGTLDVATTGIDPEVVVVVMSSADDNTLQTTEYNDGFCFGASDGTNHYAQAYFAEDNVGTSDVYDEVSASKCIILDDPSGRLLEATASMGTEKVTLDFTTVGAVGREGFAIAFGPATSGVDPLVADTGTFTLTGVATGLTANRTLSCDTASFSLTGVAADLQATAVLNATVASFALTGVDAALTASRTLTCDTGSFTLTGIAADLDAGITLAAEAGSFTLTGTDTGLAASRTLACDTASFTLTGVAVGLETGFTLACDTASYSLTGINASLLASRLIEPQTASFVLSGLDAALTYNSPDSQAYLVSIRNSSVAVPYAIGSIARPSATGSIEVP